MTAEERLDYVGSVFANYRKADAEGKGVIVSEAWDAMDEGHVKFTTLEAFTTQFETWSRSKAEQKLVSVLPRARQFVQEQMAKFA